MPRQLSKFAQAGSRQQQVRFRRAERNQAGGASANDDAPTAGSGKNGSGTRIRQKRTGGHDDSALNHSRSMSEGKRGRGSTRKDSMEMATESRPVEPRLRKRSAQADHMDDDFANNATFQEYLDDCTEELSVGKRTVKKKRLYTCVKEKNRIAEMDFEPAYDADETVATVESNQTGGANVTDPVDGLKRLKRLLNNLIEAAKVEPGQPSRNANDLYSFPEYVAFVKKLTKIPHDSSEFKAGLENDKVFLKLIFDFAIGIPERSADTTEYTWMETASTWMETAFGELIGGNVNECKQSTLLKGTFETDSESTVTQLCEKIFSTDHNRFELDHFISAIRHPDFVSFWTQV